MATFTQQEIDDAKQRQREGRGTPRDKRILEWRPGPAVPDNFDFSFLTEGPVNMPLIIKPGEKQPGPVKMPLIIKPGANPPDPKKLIRFGADAPDTSSETIRGRAVGDSPWPEGPAVPGGDDVRGGPLEPTPGYEDHPFQPGDVIPPPDVWTLPGFEKEKTPDGFAGDLDIGSIMRRIMFQLGATGIGAGIGAMAGGKQGALAGAGIGSRLMGHAMKATETLQQRKAANEINKMRAEAGLITAETGARKEEKDPILAEYLKQLAAARANPRVQLEIIESLPPEYKKHPSIITVHTGAEALRLIEIGNLGGKTRDEILRMVDAGLLTEEEGNIRIQELEDARVSEHKQTIAESAYVLAREARDDEVASAETLKARADARKDIFNKIVDLKITAAQGLTEFQARVGQMSAADAEDILENWLPFDTKIKLLGDAKTRAAKAMTLQLTAATLIEKLNDQQVIDAMGRLPGAGTRFDAWLFGKDPNRGVPSAVLEVMQLLGMASDEISRLRSGAALTETEQNFYSSLIGTMQTDPKATLQQAGGLLESMNRDLMGLYRQAYIERNGGATLTPEQEKSIPTFQNSYAERWEGLQAILGSDEMERPADVDHTDPTTQEEAARLLRQRLQQRGGR